MKELKNIVNSKIQEMITDGTIENMISEKLHDTIQSCVSDSLKSYSDFGQSIKTKIEESIGICGRDMTLPAYNLFIQQTVNKYYSQAIYKNISEQMETLIADIITPVTKTAKSSQLLNAIEKAWTEETREVGNEFIKITTTYNDEDTAMYVHLHHPEYDFYDLKFTLYNFTRASQPDNGWHIGYINIDGKHLTGSYISQAGEHLDSVAELLFQYYAMGTVFTIDQDFEDICVTDY